MVRALTTAEFIEQAKRVHGDKYDYSHVAYKTRKIKVEIICIVHGAWMQTPNLHLSGSECKDCATDRMRDTIDIFIQKAKSVHGEKYDYSRVKYVNNYTHVEIICPNHGSFQQAPSGHSQGKGCEKCARDNCKLDVETFIQRAKNIHGEEKYDYSKVVYVNTHTKVEIICPHHGSFLQTPTSHNDAKSGCKKCSESKGEKNIADILDRLKIIYERQKKFPTCRRIKCLPFDFHAEFYNLCIEYDGRQHFEPVEVFGGEEGFKKTQRNDAIKTKWCKDNNVHLLRIPYHVTDIEPLIIQKLAEISKGLQLSI